MQRDLKLGEKIKKRRIELNMTQSEVCGDFITRNMLSLIESGSSYPSIDTAVYLARKLSLPLPYLFSDDDDLIYYKKQEKIEKIRSLFVKGNYDYCIKIIDELGGMDDELNYIYANCSFELGKKMLIDGYLTSALKSFEAALRTADATVYNTSFIRAAIPLYTAVATNIQSPLLEFDSAAYKEAYSGIFDFEFYKYVTMDFDFEYKNTSFAKHLKAKRYMKNHKYYDAINILLELENEKIDNYNAYLLFGVYSDLENSYKQLADFENAYRYSSKRMSMINAFNS